MTLDRFVAIANAQRPQAGRAEGDVRIEEVTRVVELRREPLFNLLRHRVEPDVFGGIEYRRLHVALVVSISHGEVHASIGSRAQVQECVHALRFGLGRGARKLCEVWKLRDHRRGSEDQGVDRPGDERLVLILRRELKSTVQRRPAGQLIEAGGADDVHIVVRGERHASLCRAVAVAVATWVVRSVGRRKTVIEIGDADRVIPHETLERVGEPRSVPSDAEHRLGVRPGGPEPDVIGPLVDRQWDFDGIVEREGRAPGLGAVPLRCREARIDVHARGRRIRQPEDRRVAAVAQVEGVRHRVIAGRRRLRLSRLRGGGAGGWWSARRAGYSDQRAIVGGVCRPLYRALDVVVQRQRGAIRRKRRARDVAEVERQRDPLKSERHLGTQVGGVVLLIAVPDVRGVGVEEIPRATAIDRQVREYTIALVTIALVARFIAISGREDAAEVGAAAERRRGSRRLRLWGLRRLRHRRTGDQQERRGQHNTSVSHHTPPFLAHQRLAGWRIRSVHHLVADGAGPCVDLVGVPGVLQHKAVVHRRGMA